MKKRVMMTTTNPTEVIPFPTGVVETSKLPAAASYANVRFNALQHGILSHYTVLSHEDADEYADLLAVLTQEHQPADPIEAHLVAPRR